MLSPDMWGLTVIAVNLANLICSLGLLPLHHVTAYMSFSLTSLGALAEKRPCLICLYILEADGHAYNVC